MAARMEDYAIIGDTSTVGLVDRHGSIDWWCAPRIDSGAAFAALLGTRDNGRWLTFFHVALINTAANLSFADQGPTALRSAR